MLAGTKQDLLELVERVRRVSEKAGLHLNVGKTKVITTGYIGEMTVDGKDLEVVTKFVLSHIWILVYIGTQNVDLEPFGKPQKLHPRIIMDLDLLGIHVLKHTIPNRSDSHLHAYLHIITRRSTEAGS